MTEPGREVNVRDVWGREINSASVDIVAKGDAGDRHYLAKVTAPGYKPARALLRFDGTADVVLVMDPEKCECPNQADAQIANQRIKMERAFVAGHSLWSYLATMQVKVTAERAWYRCPPELPELLEHSRYYGAAPDAMHSAPDQEWGDPTASYKSDEARFQIQLTFYEPEPGRTYCEVDIDPRSGIGHFFDALFKHPISGQPDPRTVGQLMVLYCGFPLGFAMRIKCAKDQSSRDNYRHAEPATDLTTPRELSSKRLAGIKAACEEAIRTESECPIKNPALVVMLVARIEAEQARTKYADDGWQEEQLENERLRAWKQEAERELVKAGVTISAALEAAEAPPVGSEGSGVPGREETSADAHGGHLVQRNQYERGLRDGQVRARADYEKRHGAAGSRESPHMEVEKCK